MADHDHSRNGRSLVRRLFPYVVGFLAGVLVLVLVNGVRGIVDRPPQLEPGDLYILTGNDTSSGGQRQLLVNEWNARHPQSQAHLTSLGDSADHQHSEMVARAQHQNDQADVYNLDVTWIPEFAAAGYILPLDGVDTDGFLAQPLASCQFNRKLWALPFNTDAGLLYYRTDLYGPDGANLPIRVPPSEDDMRQLAARTPAGTPAIKAGYVTQLKLYEGLTVNALEAIWAEGGDVVNPSGQVTLNPDQAARALAPLAQGTSTADGQRPGLLGESLQDDETLSTAAFASGTVTMMRNWPVWYGHLQSLPPSAEFDIAKHFAVRALPDSALGGQDLAISASSKKPKAAKALIEFLTSEDSEHHLFGDGGLPATRTDVYHNADVLKNQPYAPVLLNALGKARNRPATTHYPLFSDTFQKLVDYALQHGGKLPADAVRRLTDALAGRV